MDTSTSPRPLPVFPDEVISYSTKKMSGKKSETRPPKLEIKRSRCVLFPSVNTAKAVCINNDANLSHLYNENLNETYFEQCFDNLKKLGEGSFGEVYKVRFKEDGLLYAVKRTKRARYNEVRRYELVPPNPHCVRLYKAWEQNDYLYMQMELCDDNLERYTSVHHEIPENRVWNIFLDLALGLQNLHQNNLLHLDIKPANILLSSNGTCKLGDFGLLFDLVNGNANEAVEGDSKYMAPELMSGTFTKAADIYSLGITILEVACDLDLPTNGPLWHQLRCGILPSHCSEVISEELLDLITAMLSVDPACRPSIENVLCHKKFKYLMDKRKSARNLLQMVRYTMSDWILQKIFTITNGLCLSLSRIYKKAFVSSKVQGSTVSKKALISPLKKIKRLSREPINSCVKDIIKICRTTDDTSISPIGINATSRICTGLLLNQTMPELLVSDFDSQETPPRLRRQLHYTPLGFSKKLFSADSDDDI